MNRVYQQNAVRWILLPAVLLAACSGEADFRITADMRERALRESDPRALIASAEALRRWHEEHGTAVRLEPGIDDRALVSALGGLPCALPAELEALWRWRNGESSDRFAWNHEFLPLRAALAEYRRLRRYPLLRWQREWFPVFRFQNQWFFVECAATPRVASPVMHYLVEDVPRYVFVNLTTMLATLVEATRRGAITVTADGILRDDVAAMAAIHREMNPPAAFPYAVP